MILGGQGLLSRYLGGLDWVCLVEAGGVPECAAD